MKKELEKLHGERKFGALEELLRKDPQLIGETAFLFDRSDADATTALLQVLGRVGFDYPDKVQPLFETVLKLMKDEDAFIRMDAAQAFATLFASERVAAEKGMVVLRDLLHDDNALVRGDAAGAIGNIGFYFSELVGNSVTRLLEMLDTSDDDDEREAVAHTLGKIGATNPELLRDIFPRLVHALEKTREASCGGILLAFGTAGLHYPDMVEKYIPRLIEYLQSTNEDTVRYAVLAVGNIASNRVDLVKDAIPHLERLTGVSDHDLRVNARMALSMLGSKSG